MKRPETWVWLRGLAREKRHWGRFLEAFKRRFPRTEVLLLDLPGSGEHFQATSPASISDITEILRQELQRKSTSEPYALLAISLGSMVALDWMHRHPQDFSRGVLINVSARQVGAPWERFKWLSGFRLAKAFLQKDVRSREAAILSVVSNRPEIRRENLEPWVQYAKERPMRLGNVLRQLSAAAVYGLPSQKPEAPVLVLRSENDRLVEPSCSARLAQGWDLPLQTHPTAGHDLTLDDPEWVASQIYVWLESDSAGISPAW